MLDTDTIILKKVIKRDQTAIDFTVQNCGDMEALFDVLLLNGLSLTQDIAPGQLLQAPQVEKKVTSYYEGSVLDVITVLKTTSVPGGIGYMQIGTSFKVS